MKSEGTDINRRQRVTIKQNKIRNPEGTNTRVYSEARASLLRIFAKLSPLWLRCKFFGSSSLLNAKHVLFLFFLNLSLRRRSSRNFVLATYDTRIEHAWEAYFTRAGFSRRCSSRPAWTGARGTTKFAFLSLADQIADRVGIHGQEKGEETEGALIARANFSSVRI